MRMIRLTGMLFVFLSFSPSLFAQIPELSSNPGAAYTLYLNFGGFDFSGTWGGRTVDPTPGVTPAYDIDSNPNSFSAAEVANIRNVWSRVSEKYAILNVNVTTIDPAVAAGQSSSDSARQAYYDSTAKLMHTVIGGNGNWSGGGGVSYIDTTQYSHTFQGGHTNWVFSAQSSSDLTFIAEATAHENGHGLRLEHQSNWTGSSLTKEYSPGTGTGAGSVAPIMGDSYYSERGTWRDGVATTYDNLNKPQKIQQNDLKELLANTGMASTGAGGFLDSGKGHTLATATVLPLNSGIIQSSSAKGIITPNSNNPIAIGTDNYTKDIFKFSVASLSDLNVILNSGRSTIVDGVADPGATLRAILQLLDSSGNQILRADSGILTQSLTAKGLAAGDYYLQISSYGGLTDADGNSYFDVGSYFLTGSLMAAPVPEPAFILAFSAVCLTASWRSLRRSSPVATTSA